MTESNALVAWSCSVTRGLPQLRAFMIGSLILVIAYYRNPDLFGRRPPAGESRLGWATEAAFRVNKFIVLYVIWGLAIFMASNYVVCEQAI